MYHSMEGNQNEKLNRKANKNFESFLRLYGRLHEALGKGRNGQEKKPPFQRRASIFFSANRVIIKQSIT